MATCPSQQAPKTTVKPSESESNSAINLMRDSYSLAKIPYQRGIISFITAMLRENLNLLNI